MPPPPPHPLSGRCCERSGHFEYTKLSAVNGVIAPFFFIFIMIFGYLVLGNLALAVLNETYARVAADVDRRGYYWMSEYQNALHGSVSARKREELDGKPARIGRVNTGNRIE